WNPFKHCLEIPILLFKIRCINFVCCCKMSKNTFKLELRILLDFPKDCLQFPFFFNSKTSHSCIKFQVKGKWSTALIVFQYLIKPLPAIYGEGYIVFCCKRYVSWT